ncbi:ABC transporter permease [Ferrovibrio terrae]|uniref:ABC transporter permease n=1 Tax=Ferrovibrio terrae TaxID=2594003 RepID=UPI00313786F8
MLGYIVGRLAQALAVMLAVALVAFLLFNYVGDPINNMVGQEATTMDRQELRDQLGLDDPAPVQFARFLGNAIQGNFGLSYRMKRPVAALIQERLPATLELVFLSALASLVVGLPLGVYTALRRDSWFSRVVLTTSLVGVSLPTFVIGIGLIYLLSVQFDLLPSFGRGQVVSLGWWTTGFLTKSGWAAIVMPAITLSLYQLTLVLRLVRTEMMEVLRTDYIKFARARGLSNRVVHFRHALKNTMMPVVTIVGLQIGGLIAFSIVTETVFQWPGMGLLFIQAVGFADIPVMAAYLVLVGAMFVVLNLMVDLAYFVIDPRLRVDRAKAAGKAT